MADPGYFTTGGEIIADPNNYSTYLSGGDHSNGTATVMAVSKTTNNGTNWARYDIGSATGITECLAVDPDNSNIMYAGGKENNLATIYKSTDGGTIWSKLSATGLKGTNVFDLAIDPFNTTVLYAGTDTNCYRSTNSGTTWSNTNCPGGRTNAVLLNRGSPIYEGLYAGTQSSGVYWSTNNGSTWTQINEGLLNLQVNCLCVSQANYLYAGTQGGGIHRWSIAVGMAEDNQNIEKRVFNVMPNPARGATRIMFNLTGPTKVLIKIYDIQGRTVGTLVDQECPAGVNMFKWTGIDDHGRSIASGVYIVRYCVNERSESARLIWIE